MNDKKRAYILEHWSEYNLTDTKEDFIALLNILEAWDETIDSLHNVALNGYDEFCGIVGSFEDDRDTVKALFDFHLFFNNIEEFHKWVEEQIESTYKKEDNVTIEEYIEFEEVIETTNGIVYILRY